MDKENNEKLAKIKRELEGVLQQPEEQKVEESKKPQKKLLRANEQVGQ